MDKKLEEYAIDIIKNHSHKLVKNFTEEDLINRELSIFCAGYNYFNGEKGKWAAEKEAFKNGKTIQLKTVAENDHLWCDVKGEPEWDAPLFMYRIKPEQPTYRPYEATIEFVLDFEERFSRQKQRELPLIWVKHKQTNKNRLITGFAETSVEITSKAKDVDMKKLFELYTFLDGSPCGKME